MLCRQFRTRHAEVGASQGTLLEADLGALFGNGSTVAGIVGGALFRAFSVHHALSERRIDGRDVANLVRTLASRAGVEGDFGAHSLRAGFVTSAASAKVSLDSIARTTRHKSFTVLMGYVRPTEAFDDVALAAMID